VPQVARKARNQALFREVNDRIAELAAEFEVASGPQSFPLRVLAARVHGVITAASGGVSPSPRRPTTFLVLTGHEDLDHETVVERTAGYLLVRNKPGVASQIARETAKPPPSG
jgi:hypothetical protein